MLPGIGFTELFVLAVAALIIVGPKDLPMLMRRIGQFVGKGRAMAREFQAAFDDIARQSELEDLRKEIEDLKRTNALKLASDDLSDYEQDVNSAVMAKSLDPDSAPAPDKAPETAQKPAQKHATETPSEPAPEPKGDPA